jgi:phosphoketolase
MRNFFKQFSFPGGLGSHCTPETPGSIHKGGELGYSLSHAFGAAFDRPELIVAVMVGDGEAETGPLATAWHAGLSQLCRGGDSARDNGWKNVGKFPGGDRPSPGKLSGTQDPFCQCRRPVQARAADRTSARTFRPGLQQPVHRGQADHFQFSRLRLADPQAAYRRANHQNLHVRGYKEYGNINTPLELAIGNQIDRFNLAIDVIDRVPKLRATGAHVKEWLKNQIIDNTNHAPEFGIDRPEFTNWKWPY